MCLRQARHIGEVPVDFFWMPVYILFSTLVLMPIRIYGFIRSGMSVAGALEPTPSPRTGPKTTTRCPRR